MNSAAAHTGARTSDTTVSQDATVIGLVGMAHLISHFSQLLLAPLFPWLKESFQVSYTELGFLMTLFFVVSCAVQTASGFLVDRFGPRPILFAGLGLIGLAAMGYASSTSYLMLAVSAVVGGIGNGVFHPVDYTLLNRKIHPVRLGHAYSVHGITGSLGWALAPAMLVPLAPKAISTSCVFPPSGCVSRSFSSTRWCSVWSRPLRPKRPAICMTSR